MSRHSPTGADYIGFLQTTQSPLLPSTPTRGNKKALVVMGNKIRLTIDNMNA